MTTTPWLAPRLAPGEEQPYFSRYIDLVPEGDLLGHLADQVEETCRVVARLDAAAAIRPAPGEWSAMDIAQHLVDTERVLAFRAFTFARAAGSELPSVDFEAYADAAGVAERSIDDLIAELRAVRAATVAMLRSLPVGAWDHIGVASGNRISVRALAWAIAGHDLHHLPDLRRAAGEGRRDLDGAQP